MKSGEGRGRKEKERRRGMYIILLTCADELMRWFLFFSMSCRGITKRRVVKG